MRYNTLGSSGDGELEGHRSEGREGMAGGPFAGSQADRSGKKPRRGKPKEAPTW
jgi:hypothetical protein